MSTCGRFCGSAECALASGHTGECDWAEGLRRFIADRNHAIVGGPCPENGCDLGCGHDGQHMSSCDLFEERNRALPPEEQRD